MKHTLEKNDLVICKPNGEIPEESKDHLIYARVVSVDRKADIVVLDRYLNEGQLHIKLPPELPLARLENEGYYQPMNSEEILKFRDGLARLVTSPLQANRLDNVDVSATFKAVNEAAEKIEREHFNAKNPEHKSGERNLFEHFDVLSKTLDVNKAVLALSVKLSEEDLKFALMRCGKTEEYAYDIAHRFERERENPHKLYDLIAVIVRCTENNITMQISDRSKGYENENIESYSIPLTKEEKACLKNAMQRVEKEEKNIRNLINKTDKELALFTGYYADESGSYEDNAKLIKRGDDYVLIEESTHSGGHGEFKMSGKDAVEWLADRFDDAKLPFNKFTVTSFGIEEFPKECIDLGLTVKLATRQIEDGNETLYSQRNRDGNDELILTTCLIPDVAVIDEIISDTQAKKWVAEAMQSDSFTYTAALDVRLPDARNVNLNKPVKHMADIDR